MMINDQKRYRLTAAVFVAFALFVYCSWTIIQPFNSAPDEYMHYQISQFIYQKGALPFGGNPEIINPIWGTSYGFTPILAYIIGAAFMKITSIFTINESALLMSARLVSILCNTGTVIMCFKIAGKLLTGMYRWMFVIFVALLPQFIYIGSYVNSDALAIFATSLIIYSWIYGITSKWSRPSCILLAFGISLCALSYYNAYGFILCSMILFLADRMFSYKAITTTDKTSPASGRQRFLQQTGRQAGLIIALVFILTGWWFIRNAVIYDGDFLGLHTSDYYAQINALEEFKPSHANSGYNNHWTIFYMLFNTKWLVGSVISMIGCFGYMEMYLKPVVYVIYTAIWGVSLAGLFFWILSRFGKRTVKLDWKNNLLPVTMLLTIPIPFILSVIYSYYSDFQPQGRYLLPMLLPMMYLITKGLQLVIEKLFAKTWVRRTIQILLCLWCAAAAGYCYFYILIPRYVP